MVGAAHNPETLFIQRRRPFSPVRHVALHLFQQRLPPRPVHVLEDVLVGRLAVADLLFTPAAPVKVFVRGELETVGAPAALALELSFEHRRDEAGHLLYVGQGSAARLSYGHIALFRQAAAQVGNAVG